MCGVAGWLWMVVTAFSEGESLWGILCLLIPPTAFIYGILNFREAKFPLLLMLAGGIGRVVLAVMLANQA